MTDTQPRFFEKENKLIAHLEWEAIRILCFDGSHMNIADAYPKFEQRRFYWTQKYYDNATDEYHSIKRKITNKEYQSLDDSYADLKPILKPKPRGNMLKDKKKRTSQKEFQRDAKGEGFIDNDTLLSAAAKAAVGLAEALAGEHVERFRFENTKACIVPRARISNGRRIQKPLCHINRPQRFMRG